MVNKQQSTVNGQLEMFKPGTACAWCEREARKAGVKLAYDPSQVSHGICLLHRAEMMQAAGLMKRRSGKNNATVSCD